MSEEQQNSSVDESNEPSANRRPLLYLLASAVFVLGGTWAFLHVTFFWKASIEDRPFDSARWQAESYEKDHSSRVRQEMLADLLENHLPPGTPEERVLELLGEPLGRGASSDGHQSLTWWVGPGRLRVYFIDAEFLSVQISDGEGVFRTSLSEAD